MTRYSLLDEPTFSVIDRASRARTMLTLPGVLAALTRNEVEDFPALRPHQRHVWHAFLVQLAALHLNRSASTILPDAEEAWRNALLALTPDAADGAAWTMVSELDQPAFMQPPVPEGTLSGFKEIRTPDDLDMLVTAKNHDVKRETMRVARSEHWVFALVSLQTQEGFLGAGNYGISRMNGGFASRPGIGIAPAGGVGRRFSRDARRLATRRSQLLEEYDAYPSQGGRSLLWLYPWDGAGSMSISALDVFYIEVCRRIRLRADATGGLSAFSKGTSAARIDAKALKGRTGDGWTPLMDDGAAQRKALTIDTGSFGYKRFASLVFPRSSDATSPVRAPLQAIAPDDDADGLSVLARGVVRGQGKTEGYHERRIAISASMRRFLVERPSDLGAAVAMQRVEDAGTLARKVLYPAALQVFTGAPLEGERKRDDDAAKKRAGRVLDAFDRYVDRSFFIALTDELAVLENQEAADRVRSLWLMRLMGAARDLLEQCARAAPSAAMRTYRTRARSRDVLEYAFRRYFGARLANADESREAPSDADETPHHNA
ncbi:MAG: type I-E CRISPR-associated protein Cse1/CasA [bacterium]